MKEGEMRFELWNLRSIHSKAMYLEMPVFASRVEASSKKGGVNLMVDSHILVLDECY